MVFCSIYCDMKSYFHFHQITWIAQETLCMCCHSRQKSPCWQKNNWVTNIVNIHLSSVAFLTFSLSGTKIPKTHINVDELSFICLSWHCSSCDVTIGHVHIALLMLKKVYCAAWWCTFFFTTFAVIQKIWEQCHHLSMHLGDLLTSILTFLGLNWPASVAEQVSGTCRVFY